MGPTDILRRSIETERLGVTGVVTLRSIFRKECSNNIYRPWIIHELFITDNSKPSFESTGFDTVSSSRLRTEVEDDRSPEDCTVEGRTLELKLETDLRSSNFIRVEIPETD